MKLREQGHGHPCAPIQIIEMFAQVLCMSITFVGAGERYFFEFEVFVYVVLDALEDLGGD